MKNFSFKKMNHYLVLILGSTLALSSTFAEDKSDENYEKKSDDKVEANNTGINKRDKDASRITADQQSRGSKNDVEVTRIIRRAIVKDDSLSSSAKNIKIITLDGIVYLRGPVSNEDERIKIASIAQGVVVNSKTLTNQLEIKK